LNIDSPKLILDLSAKNKWNTHQLDVKAAYLNESLDKEIFITITPSNRNYEKGYWKLNKALYSLKQSSR